MTGATDGLNRISGVIYAERPVAGTGTFSVNSNGFNENGITYDDNGNIKTLNRKRRRSKSAS